MASRLAEPDHVIFGIYNKEIIASGTVFWARSPIDNAPWFCVEVKTSMESNIRGIRLTLVHTTGSGVPKNTISRGKYPQL